MNVEASQAFVPEVLATTKHGFKLLGSNSKYLDSIAVLSVDL